MVLVTASPQAVRGAVSQQIEYLRPSEATKKYKYFFFYVYAWRFRSTHG